jgi:hypothetical protein
MWFRRASPVIREQGHKFNPGLRPPKESRMTEKLAVEGDTPVRRKKFLEYHAIVDQKEIRAISRVLKSDSWRRGPVVEPYERSLEKYSGVKHTVAVFNGTVALHVPRIGDELHYNGLDSYHLTVFDELS